MSITIDPSLEANLDRMAHLLERSVQDLANEAIRSHLERLQAEKLADETQAFTRMHADLKRTHLGQFVAIHNGEMIDQDDEFEPLFLRVQARLGSLPVLIRQVGDSPVEEWHFRSPRVESV